MTQNLGSGSHLGWEVEGERETERAKETTGQSKIRKRATERERWGDKDGERRLNLICVKKYRKVRQAFTPAQMCHSRCAIPNETAVNTVNTELYCSHPPVNTQSSALCDARGPP